MKLFERLVTKLASTALEYYLERTKRQKLKEEKKLAIALARKLAVPNSSVTVELCLFEDGSTLPRVELRCCPSQIQLARAQEFMDNFGEVRQNIRTPSPAVN